MKSLIYFLTFFIGFFLGYCQLEKETYKQVSSEFEELYNSGKYDKIFDLFSPEMKTALPLERTIAFFGGLQNQAGKIKNRRFTKFLNGSYASYKTNFERALYALQISINKNSEINGLFVRPFKEDNLPKLVRNKTKLILPFIGEWTVFWGGDTKELNYHFDHEAQKYAFDMVIMDDHGKTFRTDGITNEDYYAFGKELIAPCDAEVVLVVDGVKDNTPGELNPIYVPGNTVILKTDNNEYLFFAHFKQHTIMVKQGQRVNQGDLLGLCGNSGNSSEAHLHFHVQNIEDINQATGAKCYFEKIQVNGELHKDHSPIKGERVSNN